MWNLFGKFIRGYLLDSEGDAPGQDDSLRDEGQTPELEG